MLHPQRLRNRFTVYLLTALPPILGITPGIRIMVSLGFDRIANFGASIANPPRHTLGTMAVLSPWASRLLGDRQVPTFLLASHLGPPFAGSSSLEAALEWCLTRDLGYSSL